MTMIAPSSATTNPTASPSRYQPTTRPRTPPTRAPTIPRTAAIKKPPASRPGICDLPTTPVIRPNVIHPRTFMREGFPVARRAGWTSGRRERSRLAGHREQLHAFVGHLAVWRLFTGHRRPALLLHVLALLVGTGVSQLLQLQRLGRIRLEPHDADRGQALGHGIAGHGL